MTFFLDVWEDLREKRLWPIAAGLLAAIVATPVILFKPAAAPTVSPPRPAPRDTGPQLPAVTVNSGPTEGSKLEAFSKRNPFRPLSDLAASGSATRSSGSSSSSTARSSSSTGSSASAPSSTSVPRLSSVSSPSSSSPSTPTSSSVPSSPSRSSTPTRTQLFRYTVDVRFGPPGKLKSSRGLATMSMLPDAKTPVVVFMGVAGDLKSAVFFIADAGYVAHGKAQCAPTGTSCRFVTLTPGKVSSETFTTIDGSRSYDLQLLSVGRVQVAGKSTPPVSTGKQQASGQPAGAATASEPGLTASGSGPLAPPVATASQPTSAQAQLAADPAVAALLPELLTLDQLVSVTQK